MTTLFRPSIIAVHAPSYNNNAVLRLSDHGRSEMKVDVDRIEYRERMASGRMRSKYIGDKMKFSTSWEMLPSRTTVNGVDAVVDGGASATDMIKFYESVPGEFTISLYADDGDGPASTSWNIYGTYKVFFESFGSTVVKRGKNFDFWNIDMTLVEA